MFLQPVRCFAGLEAFGGSFNDHIVEHKSVDQALDIDDGFFGKTAVDLVGEAAAVNRQNFDEMNLVW